MGDNETQHARKEKNGTCSGKQYIACKTEYETGINDGRCMPALPGAQPAGQDRYKYYFGDKPQRSCIEADTGTMHCQYEKIDEYAFLPEELHALAWLSRRYGWFVLHTSYFVLIFAG